VSLKLPSSAYREYIIEFVATILTTVAVLQYLGLIRSILQICSRPKQLVAEVEGLFGRLPVELSERYEHPDENVCPDDRCQCSPSKVHGSKNGGNQRCLNQAPNGPIYRMCGSKYEPRAPPAMSELSV